MAAVRKKRGHGEGSIFKRVDAAGHVRWVAELMLGYTPERRRKVWRVYGKTRKEVADELAKALADQQRGMLAAGPRQTVEQFLTAWLADVAKPGTWIRTYQRYEELVRLHAVPALGKIKLQKFGAADLQALYSAKLAQGLSPQTVLHLHRCLHGAFAVAVRWSLLARNPCDLVSPPRVPKHEHRRLSPDEARALVAALRGDPFGPFCIVALSTGMREGELLGLRWSDVDVQTSLPAVHLRRSVARVTGQGAVVKETKSTQGRHIPLIALAVEALHRHRKAQLALRLQAGPRWQEQDLVFPSLVGTPIHPSNLLRRHWYPLLERAGLPRLTIHELRHSAATLLLSLGVPPKDVQAILGHSQISITMDLYGDVIPSVQREAVEKLDDLLRGP